MSGDIELRLVLRATDEGLSGVVRQVTADAESLQKNLDATAGAAGKAAAGSSDLGQKLGEAAQVTRRAATESEALQKNLDQTAKSTKKASSNSEKLRSDLDSVGDKASQVGQASDGLAKSLDRASASSRSLGDRLGDTAVKAGNWAAAIAGAALAVTGLVATLRTDAVRELVALSDTLDVNVEALTSWQFAVESVGLSGEKVGDVFKDISDKVGDFATTGGGEAADIFESLNVRVEDLINLSPDQQLLKIAGALDEVGSRSQKVFFLESIADDASRLLPLLENNAARLVELQKEAEVLGVTLSGVDSQKVVAAASSLDRIGGIFTGITNTLTVELAPIIGGVADEFIGLAIESDGFKQAIRAAIDLAISGVGFLLDSVQQLRVVLGYVEKGWLLIGQAGTAAMAATADATAAVINTVLTPFQFVISEILESLAFVVDLGAAIGGPFADEFEAAANSLRGFSGDVEQFSVSAQDLVDLNDAMADAVARSSAELEALINARAPSEELQEWIARVRAESEAAAVAKANLKKESEAMTITVTAQVDKNAELITQLEQEIELLGLSEKERFIQIRLRKLDADATKEQTETVRDLSAQIFDYEKAVKDAEKEAEPFKRAWENAFDNVDGSFRNLFRSAFDGFDDFKSSLVNTAKDLMAELAYTFSKRLVLNAVGPAFGGFATPGAGPLFGPAPAVGGGAFGVPPINGGGSIFGGIGNLFTGNGIGNAYSDLGGFLSNNLGIGNIFSGAGSISNFQYGLGALGGGFLGGQIGGTPGQFLGGIGAQLGQAASGQFLGGLGALAGPVGGVLGAVGGGFLGRLFGGRRKPKTIEYTPQEWTDAANQLAKSTRTIYDLLESDFGGSNPYNYLFQVNENGARVSDRKTGEVISAGRDMQLILDDILTTLADGSQLNVQALEDMRRAGEGLVDVIDRYQEALAGFDQLRGNIDDLIDSLAFAGTPLERAVKSVRDLGSEADQLVRDLASTAALDERLSLEQQITQLTQQRYEVVNQLLATAQQTVAQLSASVATVSGQVENDLSALMGTNGPRSGPDLLRAVGGVLNGVEAPNQPTLAGIQDASDLLLFAQARDRKDRAVQAYYDFVNDPEKVVLAQSSKSRITSDRVFGDNIEFSANGPYNYLTYYQKYADELSGLSSDYLDKFGELKAIYAEHAGLITSAGQFSLEDAQQRLTQARTTYENELERWLAELDQYAESSREAVSQLENLRQETIAWYQSQRQLADAMGAAADNVGATLDRLKFQQATPQNQLDALAQQWADAVAATQGATDYELIAASERVQQLADAYLNQAAQVFASGSDYQAVFGEVTGALAELQSRLNNEAPTGYEEAALTTLGAIQTGLDGLSTELEAADAEIVSAINLNGEQTVALLTQIRDRLNPEGSHADGLAEIPYDGYVARAHRGEAIIDARTMSGLRRYGIPVQPGSSSDNGQVASAINRLASALQDVGGSMQIKVVTPDGRTIREETLRDLKRRSQREVVIHAKGVGS